MAQSPRVAATRHRAVLYPTLKGHNYMQPAHKAAHERIRKHILKDHTERQNPSGKLGGRPILQTYDPPLIKVKPIRGARRER